MKRWLVLLIIITGWWGTLRANEIYGGPGDRLVGIAPQDTLVDTLIVTIQIPTVIGLYVNGDVTFDLGQYVSGGTYPPPTFPAYYAPTSVSGSNADGVDIQVFCNSPTSTWTLETWGSGDFSTTVALDQLVYADDGTPDPPAGTWTSFTTTPTAIATGSKTSGWQNINQDYRFRAEADDEPGTLQTTIYYRLFAN